MDTSPDIWPPPPRRPGPQNPPSGPAPRPAAGMEPVTRLLAGLTALFMVLPFALYGWEWGRHLAPAPGAWHGTPGPWKFRMEGVFVMLPVGLLFLLTGLGGLLLSALKQSRTGEQFTLLSAAQLACWAVQKFLLGWLVA